MIRQRLTCYQNRKAFFSGVGGGNKCCEVYDRVRSKPGVQVCIPEKATA